LQKGDKFQIKYISGTWTVDFRSFTYVGPKGYTPKEDKQIFQGCKLDSSWVYGRLVGKVGNGAIFPVDQGGSFKANANGDLSLRIHDVDACLVDNDGSIVVEVKGQESSPQNLRLKLPWSGGEEWFYTGGPHCDEAGPGGSCPSGAVRYAVDFVPETQGIRCPTPTLNRPDIKSNKWIVASAPGKVVRASNSIVEIQHAGGLRTGYLHLADIQVKVGGDVKAADPLGHPSCAIPPNGRTSGVHVHFYFKNGNNKISADGQTLSGWTVGAAATNYNGTMTQGGDTRTADGGRCAPNRPDLGGCTVSGIRNDLISDNYP
jgi:LasA protease